MKLIKPKYEVLTSQGLFKDIEIAARTCYKSEDKITDDSANKMVASLEERKHTAMLEHGTVYLQHSSVAPGLPGYNSDNTYEQKCIYDHFKRNKYTKIITNKVGLFITTNYRVLVENNWLDWLQFQVEPTEFHEKRISVRFTCDRGVSMEFLRHRVFSFAQESTRYCNYSKAKFGNELTFIIPCWLDLEEGRYVLADTIGWMNTKYTDSPKKCIGGPGTYPEFKYLEYKDKSSIGLKGEFEFIQVCKKEMNILKNDWYANTSLSKYLFSLRNSEEDYLSLLNFGWSPQQARSVLPNSLKTELLMTGFVSDWKGFFELRDAATAHPQAFELAHPLHEEFKRLNLL